MIATGDEQYIYSLTFADARAGTGIPKAISMGTTAALRTLEQQLTQYFNKQRTTFSCQLAPQGSRFQQRVWQALLRIPYGQSQSYKALANNIAQPTAVRAVANANACNPILVLIPCHRVIASSGALSGFAAGVERKAWLLGHEASLSEHKSSNA
jgi:methylated-DNA-[protein]-cysteine S-methyltransferase